MDMDTCDWNNYEANVPAHKPPYYEVTASGRPAHPMLTRYVPEYNDRYVEGFGLSNNNVTTLLLLLVVAILFYCVFNNKRTTLRL
jgi:hypothetical protein